MEVYAIYRILVRIRSLKWLWWSLVLLAVFSYGSHEAYLFIDREFFVAKELPFYKVCPRTDDDTLWVAVIGDSWAEFHMTLNSDCSYFWNLFCMCMLSCIQSSGK
jgi:hypothetical protein